MPFEQSCHKLLDWVRAEKYQGWDLFNGLNSRLVQGLGLQRSRLLSLAWIQFFKRSPLNLRMPALVPKGSNPKGLGLFASALLRLGYASEAKALLRKLLELPCSGYSGLAWGYNFDWQARAFSVPRGKPNMVTTVFVAQAFVDAFELTGDEKWLVPARKACTFILDSLRLKPEGCFGYIPGETTRVHNANMLGAALLGRVYSLTKEEVLFEASLPAMQYSMAGLRDDGSWPYGERHHHQFVDNFHTGFNLVALQEWMEHTGDWRWKNELQRAYGYWLNHFWLEDGCPKYYHDQLYPMDIHCSAQGIVTCVKLQEYDSSSLERAEKIAKWAIEHMQDPSGYFYYQKTRWYTNRIPYIRWSQAWMLYALAQLVWGEEEEIGSAKGAKGTRPDYALKLPPWQEGKCFCLARRRACQAKGFALKAFKQVGLQKNDPENCPLAVQLCTCYHALTNFLHIFMKKGMGMKASENGMRKRE